MTADTIETRVARGAALMDEKHPRWWAEDYPHPIDLDRLDLRSPCGCVLGQTWDGREVFSPFAAHSAALFGTGDSCALNRLEIEYGFNRDEDVEDLQVEYAALTDEWRKVIRRRRGEALRRSYKAARDEARRGGAA